MQKVKWELTYSKLTLKFETKITLIKDICVSKHQIPPIHEEKYTTFCFTIDVQNAFLDVVWNLRCIIYIDFSSFGLSKENSF